MHIPVLLNEILEVFNPESGQYFIDCTAGGGGHAVPLAERVGEAGKVLAIDWDNEALATLKDRISEERKDIAGRIIFFHTNFAHLKEAAMKANLPPAQGILFDLGFSSIQLEESGRGLSFQKNEILDMRLDRQDETLTPAWQILAQSSESDLMRIFQEYGEERYARRIAHYIYKTRKTRPIRMTQDLVGRIREAIPSFATRARIHFATRTFQALRIAANKEMENLEQGLQGALDCTAQGGKIAAISFHSLEDRIVKQAFRSWQHNEQGNVETKKPIQPGREEIIHNNRARSAKLRVFKKHIL